MWSNVPASKPVSDSSICTGKPICSRNVRPSETVGTCPVCPGKPFVIVMLV